VQVIVVGEHPWTVLDAGELQLKLQLRLGAADSAIRGGIRAQNVTTRGRRGPLGLLWRVFGVKRH
jgi:hypothetical protein